MVDRRQDHRAVTPEADSFDRLITVNVCRVAIKNMSNRYNILILKIFQLEKVRFCNNKNVFFSFVQLEFMIDAQATTHLFATHARI